MPDDFDASILTAASVAIGDAATGVIETIGDQDWFSVSMLAGQTYEIRIDGIYSDDLNTLFDPFLRGMYDSTGIAIPGQADDDSDPATRSASIIYTATYDGPHFIAASAYNQGTGSYTLSVSDLGTFDDYAASTFTTGSVFAGGSAFGAFETQGDSDWFRADLVQGVTYRFELFGDGAGTWATAPAVSMGLLRDANGDAISNSLDISGSSVSPVSSFFEYTATYSGVHYVDASTSGSDVGRYQLDLTDLGYLDDYTDSSLGSGFVAVNGSTTGEIEADGDVDWIEVTLTAGETYDIYALGLDTADGTLDFPVIEAIIDPLGSAVPYAFNGGASGGNSALRYLATASGAHHIAIASYVGHTGTYTVEVDEIAVIDDYGNNPSSDGDLPINAVVGGEIETAFDRDFFLVELTAGTVYQFDLNSSGFVDPYIYGLYSYAWNNYYNHPDNLIPGTGNDDIEDGNLDSQIIFTAPTTGDYFISAGAFSSTTGSYTLSLLTIGSALDDYANTTLTSGSLTIGGSVTGTNETEDDEDWFAVSLEDGFAYTFSFLGEDSYRSDFDLPALRVYDSSGFQAFGVSGESFTYNSGQITFTADETGTFYIAVGDDGAQNGTGYYQLSAALIGPVDDFADDITTTGTFAPGGFANTHVTGTIETFDDVDWFAVSLVQGSLYDIHLKGEETGVGTLEDPLFLGVYDNLGAFLGGEDDDSGEGLNSFSTYEATYTGTHYFAVSASPSEGSDTGSYVLQYDELGPPLDDPLLEETINEGVTFNASLTLEDVGFSADTVVDWDVTSVLFAGSALSPDDYIFSSSVGDTLDISVQAVDDDLVEDDETLTIDAIGYVDWVGPAGNNGGATYENVNGGQVFGQLQRTEVDLSLEFTINSAPEGATSEIFDYQFTDPEVIGNVLIEYLDGSGEDFSVLPFTFGGALTGSMAANGDITVNSAAAAPGSRLVIPFTVIDSRGATTLGNQFITMAELADDYLPGDDASQYGNLTLTAPATGSIETLGDRDRFLISLEAEQVYSLSLASADLSNDPLLDPAIIGLFDALGLLVDGTADDNSGTGNDALVSGFTVPEDGIYEVEVAASGDLATGDYALTATALGAVDDYLPGLFATSNGAISVGQAATGRLETEADRDRFTVELTAGHTYELNLTANGISNDPLLNPELYGVFDPLGTLVAGTTDDDSGQRFDARVDSFRVTADGLYEIEVGSSGDGFAGDYALSIETKDDFLPGTAVDIPASQFGTLLVDGTADGHIDFEGDRDRFSVDLNAGDFYALTVIGTSGISDPSLIGVFDIEGEMVAGTADGDDNPIPDGIVPIFSVEATDTYQVEIGSHGPQGGGYRVELINLGTEDDYLPGPFATQFGNIAAGQTEVGSIESAGDTDRFLATLEAGKLYTISLQGSDSAGGTLSDPALLGVYDPLNQLVSGSNDDNSGTGTDALVASLNVSADGVYEIEVGSILQGATGSYSLSLIEDGFIDDFLPGGTASQLGNVAADNSATGAIEFDTDRDRFQVSLEAGLVYEITVSGDSGGGGSLPDPELFGLFDLENNLVSGTADDNSGTGQDAASAPFTVGSDGTYEIEVGSHLDIGTGDYTVAVNTLGAVDDYLPGSFADVFGALTVDTPALGTIETAGDRDRFDVTLLAGVEYAISLEGAATGGGSLSNPELIGLFSSSGALIAGTSDDNGGVGDNALVDSLTVDQDGVYQIEVAASGDLGIGDYTLTADFVRYLDDFLPGVAGEFGALTLGTPGNGIIDSPGDTDRFLVTLDGGTSYQINLQGVDSNGGTLADPVLTGVFALDGSGPFSQSTDDDSGVGRDSLANFTPPEQGQYYVEVSGFDDEIGSYTVSIDDLGLLDDFAADVSTTGRIVPGGSATGSIDFPDDRDWFEVDLTAGRLYQIDLLSQDGPAALSDPYFYGVYDSNSVLITNTENDDGGNGANSALQFSVENSGTYYFSAGGFLETTGQYQLNLNDLGGVVDNDSFDITLDYQGPEEFRQGFEAAAARWESVITGDLPFASVEGYGFVDDILIEVQIVDIELVFEGVEQEILAISGVVEQRGTDLATGALLPTRSRIVVNAEAAETVKLSIDDLAANAIGRALGFGSLWEEFGLVQNTNGQTAYVGSNALREFADVSGTPNGSALLEDGADGGLANEYWREAILDKELMTPTIGFRNESSGPRLPGVIDNALSAITIGAMEDLGYQVNYGAADPFALPTLAGTQASVVQAPAPSPNTADPAPAALVLTDDYTDIPGGQTMYYERPNILTESPASFALVNDNTNLISADGNSALFLEGVTGQNLLIDLDGGFEKNSPSAVADLSGTVHAAEVFSQTGSRLLRFDFSQKPVLIQDLLAAWPGFDFDDENVIVVDSLSGAAVRINPDAQQGDGNQINAGTGDDYVRGGDAAEHINGGADNDILLGQGANDTLIGGSGDDIIDGGTGSDMARFSGGQTAYTLTLSPTETLIADRRTDGDGSDTLVDVELLDFSTNLFGGAFDLTFFGGPTGLSIEDFQSFIELYIAYFNRAPDAVGLNFWGTAFAKGTTLSQMATLFVDQDETKATYPPGTAFDVFAEAVYNNVLGRTPDQAGFDFWVGLLETGAVSRDAFILEVLRGAKSELDPTQGEDFVAQQLLDREYLATKTDIGTYFAVTKGMSDVSNATDAMALFDGSQSSQDAAVAAIDAYHIAALDPVNGAFLMPVVGVLDDPFAIA
ncbi:pre-peptidase C-terminal domain-containing protein [Sulfitobacter mediterraneus]|uniref:DUF4214 domain-containing protein n=1 Tax=Sulfitobacter mediterraneus TaxID=83219 RepID=UPI0019322523|nr:DUF4214 domain-containing protein [Sulfitobacter mediterraneus]MBM1633933.1 pre-peptidase C-terminal domain-containing protein [Sulfitobacter mediterraneus]MBM1641552.1 pre-peptidase C-terminal domain-containing protein [Sulfitobacter mediterraneus]MBM1645797.1 pre-peptidase C-terminal domain-containing protein [Sulfitobacter mediterraneus]MBM1649671.1 pre-peptidase C-terminal domain-containing protein [Sulfitobacter mediterraneus]MBM1653866.1 pre-peptidase C-terminal domain-containing prot